MPEKNKINQIQSIQIAEIKKDLDWIKAEIVNIKENHLKSIHQQLTSQKNWIIGILSALILTLIGVILNLVL